MNEKRSPQKLDIDRRMLSRKKMYKRRRMLAILVILVIVLIIVIGSSSLVQGFKGIGESKGKKINDYMVAGNNDITNGMYNEAIINYQNALNLDSSNENATDLIKILEGYMKAVRFYEAGDSADASVVLSNIPNSYTRYPISQKINELQNEIKKVNPNKEKQGDAKATTDILNLSNLYTVGKYKEALDLISQMEGDNLSPTQEAYVAEITIGIDQKLDIKDAKNSKFYQKGKYLTELNNLTIEVNNMDLGATTHEEKLQRATDKYNKWNDELNKILGDIQSNISASDWTKLQNDQSTWKTNMENEAKETESQYTDPLVKQTANYQKQRDLTQERCYELINQYI